MRLPRAKKNFLITVRVFLVAGVMFLFGGLIQHILANVSASDASAPKEYIYLSDLDWITENNWSYNGWDGHAIQKDKNPEGGAITLNVNGERRPFVKGIGLHARGQVTYDISAYSTDYPRFIAKLGIDASRPAVASLWFQIFGSYDGTSWESLLKTDTLAAANEAINVDLDVEGYKYLRIFADPVGSNASDHGDIADARLVKEDFTEDGGVPYDRIRRVEYYDELIGARGLEDNYSNNLNLVLERELVNKLGYWNIQNSATVLPYFEETMEWILNNERVFREVIEVGEISDGALFLEVLSNLYHANQACLTTDNGYVYEKMMIALAAAYSTDRIISPLAFSFQTPTYDYRERFTILKELFDSGKFKRFATNVMNGAEMVENEWFKDLHMELMRMVVQDGTSNIDLKWLNGYTFEKQSISFYMFDYVSPVYTQDKYFAEENREAYDAKYYLSKYGVPYGLTNGVKIARYWMAFDNGGICWNASRAGQSMYRVNGLPATGAYQPGHELYINYYQTADGDGYWSTRYGNWSGAGSTWGGGNPYRYIFNWNNKYAYLRHISGSKLATSTGYLYLGQENLNRLPQYQQSYYYDLIANSYADNDQKLDAYFKSLEVNDINLDTYYGIVNVYKATDRSVGGMTTSTDWYELAKKIVEAYEYDPVPMYDLLKVIRPYLDGPHRVHVDSLEKEKLTQATQTPRTNIHWDPIRTHANNLLNLAQPDPMTFSFDGDKPGTIVKNPSYQLAWAYSLDGGATYTDFIMDDEKTLTAAEIASITSANDIKFKFMGLEGIYDFTIDITDGAVSTLLFPNDLENRVVGVDLTYEWRNNESDPWTSYREGSPDNTGDKTLYVRRGNTGTQLASNSVTYTFTADNQPNTRKYVAVSHLSIAGVSTEATSQGGAAANAIDGNYNTRYHSAWNGSDTERWVSIKLDKPRYVSAVEFVPAGGGNGKIYDGTVYGSMDGENWEVLSQMTGLTYRTAANTNDEAKVETKSFEIAEPKEVQYIKIKADRSNANWFTARAFNIFQDLTLNERPTGGVGYSTTSPTTENVIARLVNISAERYEILSEGGESHTFTDNGEFTFRFRDLETGLEGSTTAVVDWIDRIAPTGTILYSTTAPVHSSVFVTLNPSEEVKVLNNGYYEVREVTNDDGALSYEVLDASGNVIPNYTVDENGAVKDVDGRVIDPFRYELLDNGEFTFEFVDQAGNRGSATASVSWIDFDAPEATVVYDRDTLTNQNVTATVNFSEAANVTNNGGSASYTFTQNGEFIFTFADAAGNEGTVTAKVDWIDKVAPTAELKYEERDGKVVVTVVNPSEEISFAEGIGVYEFTQNGNYTIIFRDKAGNEGRLIAKITSFRDPSKPDDLNQGGNIGGDTGNNGGNTGNTGGNGNNNGNGGAQGGTNGGNNTGNSGSTGNTTRPNNTEYKKFNLKNLTIEIPAGALGDGMTVKADKLDLYGQFVGKFDENSEYYDIYAVDADGNRVEIASDSLIKISANVKELKNFIGVYEIVQGDKLKLISYEKNGGKVEWTTHALGKFVMAYGETKPKDEDLYVEPDKNGANGNGIDWALVVSVSAIGVVALGVVALVTRKALNNTKIR